jgi:hypothetical protein
MIDDLIREIEEEIDTDGSPSSVEPDGQESVKQHAEDDSEDQGYTVELQNEGETL